MRAMTITGVSLAALTAAFFITDCSCGSASYCSAVVTDKVYKKAWTELKTRRDSEGHTHFRTVRHPEEFHLICNAVEHEGRFDFEVTKDYYESTPVGQDVVIHRRMGKWTGIGYLPVIDNPQPKD